MVPKIEGGWITMSKRILIIGDYTAANWHPLTDVDKQLERILTGNEITCTEDYANLTLDDLQHYDMLINYVDAWKDKGTHELAGAMIGYVASGGSFLSLHSGIIMHTTPEMELMQAAKFTGHPPACDLLYTPLSAASPILEGIAPFTLFEEPYQFEMDEIAEYDVFMTYAYEGQDWPAAWAMQFGQGKMVYLSMGHNAKVFECEAVAQLIRNSIKWCTEA